LPGLHIDAGRLTYSCCRLEAISAHLLLNILIAAKNIALLISACFLTRPAQGEKQSSAIIVSYRIYAADSLVFFETILSGCYETC
jgi:hypothetical protein